MSLNTDGVLYYSEAGGVASAAAGGYTGDGSGSFTLFCGFSPKWVKIVDITGVLVYEWIQGMPATNSVKTVTGGTTTIDTNSAIVSGSSIITETTAGVYKPGSQGPGGGTLVNTTIVKESPNTSGARLTIGSVCNVSAHVYAYTILG
jgi:hypothetical protein